MRVPWIRVHGHLIDKPVVSRLVKATGVNRHEACGVLITFWSGVAENADNGLIRGHDDHQLEKWASWPQTRTRRGKFAAWVRAEHMDSDGRVPEWDDYAGELEYQRERNRINQQKLRDRRKTKLEEFRARGSGDRNGDVSDMSPTTRRNETKRDETKEELLSRPRAKKPRESSPELPWVPVLTDLWIDKVGAVVHGRLGKAFKPIVDKHGVESVSAAIDVYASADEGPKNGRSVELFAQNFQHWLRIARTPLADATGLTARGQRVGIA